MKKLHLSVPLFLFVFINLIPSYASADRYNNTMDRTMNELDAEIDKIHGKPEVRVETKIVEKVIIKEVYVPVPVTVPSPVAAPVAQIRADPEPAPVPSNNQGITVEADGYVFQLANCGLSHRNIKCDLNIISTEDDGNLTLYSKHGRYSTKLFDRLGNEYHPSKVVMGNKNSAAYITNRYIAGVTALGSIHFENVGKSSKAIALIELGMTNNDNRKYSRIKFRNVNLSM